MMKEKEKIMTKKAYLIPIIFKEAGELGYAIELEEKEDEFLVNKKFKLRIIDNETFISAEIIEEIRNLLDKGYQFYKKDGWQIKEL